MPKEDEDKQKSEVEELMAIFMKLAKAIKSNDGEWDTLEELMEARANIAIKHAFDGFGISFDDAIELIERAEDLTDEQRVNRDIIIAAVDNLVDFSVAQEYQMAMELPEFEEESEEESDEDEIDEDVLEGMLAIFTKYNDRYAKIENLDIEYAMMVAAFYKGISDSAVLTYMTQGDNRVRPWHRQYEGFTAPKSHFPAWLIPPIEHNCRCFLVEDSKSVIGQIQNKINVPDMPEWFNPVFKESVALGGRIFSEEHSYFQIAPEHFETLYDISLRIKSKYKLNGENTN